MHGTNSMKVIISQAMFTLQGGTILKGKFMLYHTYSHAMLHK